MPRPRLSIAILSSVILIAAFANHADAQFSDAARECRSSLGKHGAKMLTVAAKTLAKCHKNRNSAKFLDTVDCNAQTPDSDPKFKIDKAGQKMFEATGDFAKSKCNGLTPADVGFASCPAPCAGDFPVILNMDHVSSCVVCVLIGDTETAFASIAGTPVPLLNKIDGKCHGRVLKAHTALRKTAFKARARCQDDAEEAGAILNDICTTADPKGKILKTRNKIIGKIEDTCASAVLTDVDSCSDVSPQGLAFCVANDAEATTTSDFEAAYPDK